MATPVQFGATPSATEDGRLDAPAFHRNHQAIWSVLAPVLEGGGDHVLELGSGTGQHAVTFAALAPHLTWWPSDLQDAHLASIDAWRDFTKALNVQPAHRIDLTEVDWFAASKVQSPAGFRAIFCANVVHIAPWRVAEGLFAGAARYLEPDGVLALYGPFKRDGQHTADSNAQFDASLRARDPSWGVRDMAELADAARNVGLALDQIVEMPANNFILTFGRNKTAKTS